MKYRIIEEKGRYYPQVSQGDGVWEDINDYRIVNGHVESNGIGCDKSRAEHLITLAKEHFRHNS